MSKKVKLGVVGLGGMGSSHLGYLSKMDTIEIAGVCDIEKEKADDRAKTYNTQMA